jgi:hypothetical protein
VKKVLLFIIAAALFADSPWLPNIQVSQDPGSGNQNETTMAIFQDSLICTGWNDSRQTLYHVGFAASIDGGQTWQETLMIEPTYPSDADPVLAVDEFGDIYYIWLSYDGSSFVGDIYLTKSTDWGQTWGSSVCLTPGTPNTLDDKPWATIDGNNVFLTWYEFFGTGGLMFKRSTDYGQTWGPSIQVGSGGNGTMAFRGIDSTVFVGWGYQDLRLNKSTDMGQTWAGMQTIITCPWSPPGTPYRINNIPCYKTSQDRSILYVIFSDSRHGAGQIDISFSRSTDNGTTWMTPVRVNDIQTGLQFYPFMAIGNNDVIHASWHDTREGSTTDIAQYYAYSTDFGLTWSANERLSDTVTSTSTFIGDYTACAVDNNYVYACWCDCRNGSMNPDVFFSKRPNDIGLREQQIVISPNPSGLTLSFPNPCSNLSTIHFTPYDAEVTIYTADGRAVEQLGPSGIYFVNVRKGGQSLTKKLIKIK